MIENYMTYFDLCSYMYTLEDENFEFFSDKLQDELDKIPAQELPNLLEVLKEKYKVLKIERENAMSIVNKILTDSEVAKKIPAKVIENARTQLQQYPRIEHFYSETLNQINSMVLRNNNVK